MEPRVSLDAGGSEGIGTGVPPAAELGRIEHDPSCHGCRTAMLCDEYLGTVGGSRSRWIDDSTPPLISDRRWPSTAGAP